MLFRVRAKVRGKNILKNMSSIFLYLKKTFLVVCSYHIGIIVCVALVLLPSLVGVEHCFFTLMLMLVLFPSHVGVLPFPYSCCCTFR